MQILKISLILVFFFMAETSLLETSALAEDVIAEPLARKGDKDDYTDIITSKHLNQSVSSYDKNEWGDLKTIIKTWNETYDARSRFDVSFYGYSPEFRKSKSIFLQTIKVYDNQKEIMVHDWESAECSLEKMLLMRKLNSTYLVLGDRATDNDSTEIFSQNVPERIHLRLFKLSVVGSNQGRSQAFFEKISEHKTEKKFCSDAEFYAAMQQYAQSTVRK